MLLRWVADVFCGLTSQVDMATAESTREFLVFVVSDVNEQGRRQSVWGERPTRMQTPLVVGFLALCIEIFPPMQPTSKQIFSDINAPPRTTNFP